MHIPHGDEPLWGMDGDTDNDLPTTLHTFSNAKGNQGAFLMRQVKIITGFMIYCDGYRIRLLVGGVLLTHFEYCSVIIYFDKVLPIAHSRQNYQR